MSKESKTFGIYVPSYKRADKIMTYHLFNTCKYVVRVSQEQDYLDAGIARDRLIAVEDDKINSWCNVMNWIVENAEEDLIAVCDDDLEKFMYRTDYKETITDPQVVEDELCRLTQILSDLEIGFGALMFTPKPFEYHSEFEFTGTLGACYMFNRECVKGKFDNKASAVADAEFELQELLQNRIILRPKYIVPITTVNKGTNTQNRTSQVVRDSALYTQQKWGKYFKYDAERNKTRINVKR